jgi:hypothetical protein
MFRQQEVGESRANSIPDEKERNLRIPVKNGFDLKGKVIRDPAFCFARRQCFLSLRKNLHTSCCIFTLEMIVKIA